MTKRFPDGSMTWDTAEEYEAWLETEEGKAHLAEDDDFLNAPDEALPDFIKTKRPLTEYEELVRGGLCEDEDGEWRD